MPTHYIVGTVLQCPLNLAHSRTASWALPRPAHAFEWHLWMQKWSDAMATRPRPENIQNAGLFALRSYHNLVFWGDDTACGGPRLFNRTVDRDPPPFAVPSHGREGGK
jgi:hypothetical protein